VVSGILSYDCVRYNVSTGDNRAHGFASGIERSGAYLDNCQILALPKIDFPDGEENGRVLWTRSEQLVGQEFKRL
jgi:hypothetical protein